MIMSKILSKKITLIVVLAIIGALVACIVARFMTIASPYGANPLMIVFAETPETIASLFMANLMDIAWHSQNVWIPALIAFMLPFSIGLVCIGKGFDANYDTGKEHGDSHLATKAEMNALLDTKFHFNNLHYTENSGLPLKAWNKKLDIALTSRNFNMICFGISGTGKTFHLSKPVIMNSVGCRVPYVQAGLQNIIEHLQCAAETHRILTPIKPLINALHRSKQRIDAHKHERMANQAKKRGIGDGYDLLITDPKGDDLRDIGHLHQLAGQDISVLNLVDLESSMGYNPLAYIKTQEIDIKDPSDIEIVLSGQTWINDKESNKSDVEQFDFAASQPKLEKDVRIAQSSSVASFSSSVSEETRSYSDLSALPEGYNASEVEKELSWIKEDMGDGGCQKVAEIVSETTYTRTGCVLSLEIKNNGSKRRSGEFVFALDEALEVESIQGCVTANFVPTKPFLDSVSIEQEEGSNRFVWRFKGLPAAKPASPEDAPTIRCNLFCKIAPMSIPDGVDLAKTVNTLVENLGSHDEDGAGGDPFWEDAKRLFFMGLIAYQFERYPDPKYHTIPVMCDLMDVALSDGGDVSQPSALKAMMDVWEYAKRPIQTQIDKNASMRGVLPESQSFAKTDNPPHDRSRSLALHCYRAFAAAAPETVQSIVISCQTALIKLLSPQIKRILSKDELHLDRFGDEGPGKVLYLIVNDNDDTYAFFTALLVHQTIELSMTKAYKRYGGKLPRHVRLELDECKNIGKVPNLVQATSTVRSRNMSIAMYFQSYSQAEEAYGEKGAHTITNNCTTWMFLGAQHLDDLKMISEKIGEETVYARTYSRQFNGVGVSGTSEQISANARAVQSSSQINQTSPEYLFAFYYGVPAVKDLKYITRKDPLYCYVDAYDQAQRNSGSLSRRKLTEPIPRFAKRFDYVEELMKGGKKRGDPNDSSA